MPSERDGPRAGHRDQLRAERAWAWLARLRLDLVQREGYREAAADPAVGAGAGARHDGRGPGDALPPVAAAALAAAGALVAAETHPPVSRTPHAARVSTDTSRFLRMTTFPFFVT